MEWILHHSSLSGWNEGICNGMDPASLQFDQDGMREFVMEWILHHYSLIRIE